MNFKSMDVYKCAISFVAIAWKLIRKVPRGNSDLIDQLKRASLSIPLNIGEGAGRKSPADVARHYNISRGSAMECSAILDVMKILNLAENIEVEEGEKLLIRIVSMLTKLSGI